MIGASRGSLASVQESLNSRADQGDLSALSAELFAVATLLGSEKSLVLTLADSGQSAGSRSALVNDLLGNKVSALTVSVITDVVNARWSSPSDLVDAIELLAAQAGFISANRDGSLDRVESELFHFGRAVDASSELQMSLTDPALSAQAKAGIIRDLLADKVSLTSLSIITYVASHLRGRRVDSLVSQLTELAAAQRNQVVAQVTSVVALDDGQQQRLIAALNKLTGKNVRLNVAVDPTIIGGFSVKIGEDIIDGTIASRLEDARRALLA